MEHPINSSIDALENDSSLSVTALSVALALLFIIYFTLRAAAPALPLYIQHALADLPSSEQPANALSMLR